MFLWHAPAIILDNRSGNVAEQIVNGTKGLMESLLWENKIIQRRMEKLIRCAIKCSDTEIMLDTPPDFTMMSLMDSKNHKRRSKHTLPKDFILLQDENSDMFIIPVGYGKEDNVLEVGSIKTKNVIMLILLSLFLHSLFGKFKA